jgi:hypothetical protein
MESSTKWKHKALCGGKLLEYWKQISKQTNQPRNQKHPFPFSLGLSGHSAFSLLSSSLPWWLTPLRKLSSCGPLALTEGKQTAPGLLPSCAKMCSEPGSDAPVSPTECTTALASWGKKVCCYLARDTKRYVPTLPFLGHLPWPWIEMECGSSGGRGKMYG